MTTAAARDHVTRHLVPLVRAAACLDFPLGPLDDCAALDFQDLVDLTLVDAYCAEVDRRWDELPGDLENWKPAGILGPVEGDGTA